MRVWVKLYRICGFRYLLIGFQSSGEALTKAGFDISCSSVFALGLERIVITDLCSSYHSAEPPSAMADRTESGRSDGINSYNSEQVPRSGAAFLIPPNTCPSRQQCPHSSSSHLSTQVGLFGNMPHKASQIRLCSFQYTQHSSVIGIGLCHRILAFSDLDVRRLVADSGILLYPVMMCEHTTSPCGRREMRFFFYFHTPSILA